MTIVKKAKENMLLTAAVGLAVIAAGVTGGRELWAFADVTHTTEAELLIYDLKAHTFASQQFAGLESKLDDYAVENKCRYISAEIRSLQDSIYVRERDGADEDYIRELEKDLGDYQRDYAALECAKKLA